MVVDNSGGNSVVSYYDGNMEKATKNKYDGISFDPGFDYDVVKEDERYLIVTTRNRDGYQTAVLNRDGKIIVPPQNVNIYSVKDATTGNQYFILDNYNTGESALCDSNGNIIINYGIYKYDGSGSEMSSLRVRVNNDILEYGIIDFSGNILLPVGKYTNVGSLTASGYISASNYSGNLYSNGAITDLTSTLFLNGQEVLRFNDRILQTRHSDPDLIIFIDPTTRLQGIMRTDGSQMLPADYKNISIISNSQEKTSESISTAITYIDYTLPDGRHGLKNLDWDEVLPASFRNISILNKDRNYIYVETMEGRKGLFRADGTQFLSPQYAEIEVCSNELIFYSDTGDIWHVINSMKNEIFPCGNKPSLFDGLGLAYTNENSSDCCLWLAIQNSANIDDYLKADYPIVVERNDGIGITYYIDCETGEIKRVIPYPASNINLEGVFAYRGTNGLYGMAVVDSSLV